MSVAGIIDAMRSSYAPTVRLIWQCLENHANGARWWRMTHEDIAAELHLSLDTVGAGVAILERDRITRCVRHKRRPTTFYMLRSYPEGCPRPRHEPEVARRVAPELTPETPASTPELTPEIPATFFHQKETPPEEEEDARARASLTPVAETGEGEGKEARRIEVEQAASPVPSTDRVPFPDEDPELDPTEIAEIKAAGHDPAELRDEVREWAHREGATSNNWPRVIVHWARQTPPPRRRSAPGQARPAKQSRAAASVAAFMSVIAANRAARGEAVA